MGLGVLDVKGQNVPGTETILESQTDHTTAYSSDHNPRLKYDTTGKTPILLVPQPSDDPLDPLNWPLWKRDLILVTLSLLAVVATTLSPILAADSLALTYYFAVNFTGVAMLTGYHLLGVGVGGLLFVPSARIWGKRHAYLLGTVIVCFSSAWAGASTGKYKSMLAARFIQGVGLAPFEALLGASVGDLYHVHQRGLRMALSTLAVFGSAFMTPVIVGLMSDTIGWQWSFYLVAILSGALLPVCFFFCPETAYVRAPELNLDMSNNEKISDIAADQRIPPPSSAGTPDSAAMASKDYNETGITSTDVGTTRHHPTQIQTSTTPQSYWRTLLPFNGRKTDDSFIKLFFRPFPLFLQPGILWACLTQGALIGWTVFIGIVLAAILLGPPLYFSSTYVGYMYSAAFIGALIGFVLCGLIADPGAKLLTKWNKGVYEPEFRIWLVVPQLILGGIGLYGFGYTAGDLIRYGYLLPAVFFGFVTAGMVFGAVASSLYIVDAHRDLAIEAFTCLIIFKNIFSFALTFKGYDWLVQSGVHYVFIVVASVQVGICCLSVFMYVFGKWNRYYWSKYDILAMLRLR